MTTLSNFIDGLQDGLSDEQHVMFRTMFVTKRDVSKAIALAKFYLKAGELLSHEMPGASLVEFMQHGSSSDPATVMILDELRELETHINGAT